MIRPMSRMYPHHQHQETFPSPPTIVESHVTLATPLCSARECAPLSYRPWSGQSRIISVTGFSAMSRISSERQRSTYCHSKTLTRFHQPMPNGLCLLCRLTFASRPSVTIYSTTASELTSLYTGPGPGGRKSQERSYQITASRR